MKILMIGWGFPPKIQGGLDIHVYEICRELAKANEVYLTLPEFNSPGKDVDGIKIIPVKCPDFSNVNSLVRSVKVYNRNIVKGCGNLDFDVIHSHDWFGIEASEWLKIKTKKPWILTLHSLEYMRSCENSKKSVMEKLERRGSEACDRIIAVSRFMKNSIAKKYGVGTRKIEVVYNSAGSRKGNPEAVRKKFRLVGNPVVLFLGRLSGQKGPEYFIHSAKLVLEKIPDARFLVVGDGNLKGSLEKFSHHLGLDGKVIFTGFVPEKDIASYYSASDVFVSPSLYEPFGITVLESLLSGTPAIVSENAGVVERISQMECIHKIKPGNSKELVDGIVSVLKGRKRVSEKQKSILKKTYSWEKSAKETLHIYQKLM